MFHLIIWWSSTSLLLQPITWTNFFLLHGSVKHYKIVEHCMWGCDCSKCFSFFKRNWFTMECFSVDHSMYLFLMHILPKRSFLQSKFSIGLNMSLNTQFYTMLKLPDTNARGGTADSSVEYSGRSINGSLVQYPSLTGIHWGLCWTAVSFCAVRPDIIDS